MQAFQRGEESQLQHNLMYTSDISPDDDAILRALSTHFTEVFIILSKEPNVVEQMKQQYDHMLEAIIKACKHKADQQEKILSLHMILSFFKITHLTDDKNKVAQLIAVASKAQSFFNFYDTDLEVLNEQVVAACLFKGDVKSVVDRLNRSAQNPPDEFHRKVISLLQSRDTLYRDYLNRHSYSQMPVTSFKSQQNDARQQLANMDEKMDGNLMPIYRGILQILGGDFDYMVRFNDNFVSLIQGYLLFIDPFLSENDRHAYELLRNCNPCSTMATAQILVMTLSSDSRSEEILEMIKKCFPAYIYHSLQLYANYLDRIYRNNWSERAILIGFLEFFANHRVDFFTAKPFFNRLLQICRGSLDRRDKELLKQVCLETFNSARNKSSPKVYRDCQTVVTSWLTANKMPDVANEVKEEVFETIGAMSSLDDSVAALLDIILDDSTVTSLLKLERFFELQLAASEYGKLMRSKIDNRDQSKVFKLFRHIKQAVDNAQITNAMKISPAFSFLKSFSDLVHKVEGLLVQGRSNDDDVRILGELFSDIAREFCHVSGLFKLVFSMLLACGGVLKLTVGQADALLDAVVSANGRLRFDKMRRDDEQTLKECIQRNELLLLKLRSQATFL